MSLSGRRPRVLFYSHDAIGLGHMSRVAVIMCALGRIRPDVVQLLVSGAENPNAFPLPPGADTIRLPVAKRAHLYGELPPASDYPSVAFTGTGIWQLRARVIEAAALGFLPDIVCVDHQPEGIYGELTPALSHLKRIAPATQFVAVLDEFMDQPPAVARRWEDPNDLLLTTYDQIVIRGDRAVFDTADACAFPPEVLAKTSYSGYVARRAAATRGDAAVRAQYGAADRPLVLVTSGSGRDGVRIVQTYLAALREAGEVGFASVIVAGPAYPEKERTALHDAARSMTRVHVLDESSDVPGLMRAADLVVTMAGYSAMAEVLDLGKRAIAIPRAKPWPEQVLRATRLDELGLITMLHPDRLDPESLWVALLHGLSTPGPSRWVNCRGDDAIAALLDGMLRPVDDRAAKAETGSRD